MKFRKKPVVIDAIRFDGANFEECEAFCGTSTRSFGTFHGTSMMIRTLEGDMFASSGDWIIKGVKGEFYPCKPDIFAATYDECGEHPEGKSE